MFRLERVGKAVLDQVIGDLELELEVNPPIRIALSNTICLFDEFWDNWGSNVEGFESLDEAVDGLESSILWNLFHGVDDILEELGESVFDSGEFVEEFRVILDVEQELLVWDLGGIELVKDGGEEENSFSGNLINTEEGIDELVDNAWGKILAVGIEPFNP